MFWQIWQRKDDIQQLKNDKNNHINHNKLDKQILFAEIFKVEIF